MSRLSEPRSASTRGVLASKAPILCYVTDGRNLAVDPSKRERELLGKVKLAAAAGLDWIQVREKDLTGKEESSLVRHAMDCVRRHGDFPDSRTRICVNERLDAAIAEGADGAHFGENSLPFGAISEIRHVLAARLGPRGTDFALGFSCHSLESARLAAAAGVDYIFFGPVFETPSKAAFGPPQGLPRLAEVCAGVSIPVIAIGGINLKNAAECIRAGAAGMAAIRIFQESKNLQHDVQVLREAIGHAEGAGQR